MRINNFLPTAVAIVSSVFHFTDALANCKSRHAIVQIGTDTLCGSGFDVYYPIHDMDPSECRGLISGDGAHVNSINNYTCNPDGSYSMTQYAGNIDCSGTGTRKTFYMGQCGQDIPPTLYSTGLDFSCCADPDSPQCQSTYGNPPTVQSGAVFYLNGEECAQDDDSVIFPVPTPPAPSPSIPAMPSPITQPVTSKPPSSSIGGSKCNGIKINQGNGSKMGQGNKQFTTPAEQMQKRNNDYNHTGTDVSISEFQKNPEKSTSSDTIWNLVGGFFCGIGLSCLIGFFAVRKFKNGSRIRSQSADAAETRVDVSSWSTP
jgi:hypothetical protein